MILQNAETIRLVAPGGGAVPVSSLKPGDALLLAGTRFVLPRGFMYLVTGASGSGKSVLLRLAMGLERPDSGEVFVEGREIETLGETELLRLRSEVMCAVWCGPLGPRCGRELSGRVPVDATFRHRENRRSPAVRRFQAAPSMRCWNNPRSPRAG